MFRTSFYINGGKGGHLIFQLGGTPRPPFPWDPIPPRKLSFSQPIKSLVLWKIYDSESVSGTYYKGGILFGHFLQVLVIPALLR